MTLQTTVRFVICVRNEGCEDLELRKLYQVLPDDRAAQDDYLRVIDESGEDYLYPASYFVQIIVPEERAEQLQQLIPATVGAGHS